MSHFNRRLLMIFAIVVAILMTFLPMPTLGQEEATKKPTSDAAATKKPTSEGQGKGKGKGCDPTAEIEEVDAQGKSKCRRRCDSKEEVDTVQPDGTVVCRKRCNSQEELVTGADGAVSCKSKCKENEEEEKDAQGKSKGKCKAKGKGKRSRGAKAGIAVGALGAVGAAGAAFLYRRRRSQRNSMMMTNEQVPELSAEETKTSLGFFNRFKSFKSTSSAGEPDLTTDTELATATNRI